VELAPFLVVAVVVAVTPGVDMALVTRNALRFGRRAAVQTALGINLGILFWVIAAGLGLAAVVAASATAFAAIKLAGAVYLICLGVLALLRARGAATAADSAAGPLGRSRPFRQGLVSNLLNPKIAVFFTSLLPQFAGTPASPGRLLLLGLLFNAIGVAWLTAYALLAARGGDVLRRPAVKRALDRLNGIVLIGLGARLAFERRP
jgi:threonine/homoserine/homoserine lactone efflux protein